MNSTLTTEVADQLRNLILDGSVATGDRIIERNLADQYAVSRTIAREVIRKMVAEGLVELIEHKGAYITKLKQREVQEILEIHAMFERNVFQRYCEMDVAKYTIRLQTITIDLVSSDPKSGILAYLKKKRVWFSLCFEVTEMPMAWDIYIQLKGKIGPTFYHMYALDGFDLDKVFLKKATDLMVAQRKDELLALHNIYCENLIDRCTRIYY